MPHTLRAILAEVQFFTWPRLRILPVQPDRVWLEVTGAAARPWCNLHLDGTVDLHYPADPLLSLRELQPSVHHDLIWHLSHELAHVLWWKTLPQPLRELTDRAARRDDGHYYIEVAEMFALLTQILVAPRLDEVSGTDYYTRALDDIEREPGYERAMKWARQAAQQPDAAPFLARSACEAVGVA